MELGAHIKEHRKELGLSQDDLAAKIYVSRQTISNWEVGRTYPDVQSLLLLSNVFGVTVDSLIKGDVETMAQVMDAAVKKYNALSTITVVSAVVFLALSAWAAFQFEWGWGIHIAPHRRVRGNRSARDAYRLHLHGAHEEAARPRHVPRGACVQPRRAG